MLEAVADAFAEADKGFLHEGEAAAFKVADAPGSFELLAARGEEVDAAVGNFLLGDPRGEDADADPDFDEFLDGFHGAELDDFVEGVPFRSEVAAD